MTEIFPPPIQPTPVTYYKLRLFVTGVHAAIGAGDRGEYAADFCEENPVQGRYDLEVVDVYENPEATKELAGRGDADAGEDSA